MFKRFGKMFVQGARAEIEENGAGIDIDGLIKGGCLILEGLIFFGIMLSGGKTTKAQPHPSTIVINNYIQKGE